MPIFRAAYSFIMFGCFSKKKKLKPDPPVPNPSPSQQSTVIQSSTEAIPRPLPTTVSKHANKSKFCPIGHAENVPTLTQQKNCSLTVIDRMLGEELQDSSIPNDQEDTTHFADILPDSRMSVFGDISPVLAVPGVADGGEMRFKDTKSVSFDFESYVQQEEEAHMVPKLTLDQFHTIKELTERSTSRQSRKHKRSSKISQKSSKQLPKQLPEFESGREFWEYDQTSEEWALRTTITLENFKISPRRIRQKMCEQSDEDDLLEETLEQAENSFYCGGSSQEQFARATISSESPVLARRIFSKMTAAQKNVANFKGYTPVQLLVLKTIRNEAFLNLTKCVINDPEVILDCRGPTGWTPLQQALFYRNIPLATHLFKASYAKKQRQFKETLLSLAAMLESVADFELDMEVKVDSFLPLVGNLTPSDTLTLIKKGRRLRLKYSLVGYEFPSCKRRQMEILFDGERLLGVNLSKGTCCDLLQGLQQEEMMLMLQDMLTGQMKRGWPIVHSVSLNKALSIFQNEITAEVAGSEATKHTLNLCYTSTAEKRRSQVTNSQQLDFLASFTEFKERRQSLTIKEKNRNKRVELEVWLAKDFGLQLGQLLEMLEVLSMGNSFIAEWSKFFKEEVGQLVQQSGMFPVKIDIPLSYSLFFNIEFRHYRPLPQGHEDLILGENISKVPRKEFQGTLGSKEKRSLFIQAYT